MLRYAKSITFYLFFITAFQILSPPNLRVHASVLRVDETCSLHDAIIAANTDNPSGNCPAGAGADTIYLTGDVTLSEALPIIKSVISIDGSGYRISGEKRFKIFKVGERPFGRDDPDSEIKLTINRLIISGSRSTGLGSALYIAIGAEVNIYDSQISDSVAREGGAIFNWGDLSIANSTLSNNIGTQSGGAIENHGSGTLRVLNSVFRNNSAGYQGGAIFSSGPATVRSSSFAHNAALEGGAIFSSEDELSVVNSTFSKNTGADAGGALYLQQSRATLSHLTVYGNESKDGGGLFRDGGAVNLYNSIIGGSIDAADCLGGLNENYGNLIEDGSCEPKYARSPRLQALSGSPPHHRLFSRSPAIGNGEVEYCENRDQLGNNRRERYECDIGAIEREDVLRVLSSPGETAPPLEEPACTLAEQILAANRDEAVGACPAGRGVDIIHIEGDIRLRARLPKITSEIVIMGNGHSISGAYRTRIFDIGETGHLTIHNLNIARGKSAIQGGAIRLLGGTLQISNSTIRDSHSGYGGAIYVEHGILEIEDSNLSANSAHFGGGAIASEDGSTLTISDSIINNNVARGGGALSASDSNLTLISSTISNNSAHYGGAIFSSGGHSNLDTLPEDNTVAIVASTISHNRATHFGGAINSSSKALTIKDSAFRGNQTGVAGGALIIVYGTLYAEKSSFVENAAGEEGGAIYSESMSLLNIANSTFSSNTADEGGALMVGDSVLTHVTIANNVAKEAGGIYALHDVALRNSIVAGNVGGDCAGYTDEASTFKTLIGDASCEARLSGDPMLNELDGRTGHHPLRAESLAIDSADPEHCPARDQIGNLRPQGDGCDIGAIEFTASESAVEGG